MISFRYHVVTIVAVFLALGLGVLMGTTVVKQSVIDELRNRADNAIDATHALQKNVTDLRDQVRLWENAAPVMQQRLIGGQLAGRTVVLVTADGVDFAEVDGVRKALNEADAAISAVLQVTSRMGLADDGVRTKLAALLGLSADSDPEALSRQAAEAMAVRLAQGPSQAETPDLLQELSANQLLVVGQDPQGLDHIGGPDQSVLVLSGGTGQPASEPQAFLVPLVESLVESGQPVVAGETFQTDYEFVALVRKDGAIDGSLVTVDNADTMFGRVAIVLGLRNMLDSGLSDCGDYGVKSGACGALPALPAAP